MTRHRGRLSISFVYDWRKEVWEIVKGAQKKGAWQEPLTLPFTHVFDQGQPGLIKPAVSVSDGGADDDESSGAGGGEKRKRRKRRKKYDFSDDLAARQEDEKRLAQEVCDVVLGNVAVLSHRHSAVVTA